MTKITVLDGALYQWDTGRKVQIVTGVGTSVSEVHFSDPLAANAFVVAVDAPGNEVTASVPDILLQTFGTLTVYAVVASTDGRRTKHARSFTVAGRPKPDDYVYTETEVLDYRTLEKRIDEIERNGVSDEQIETAVTKYLDENPIDTGVQFETDATLTLKDGILSVNTADDVEEDNTLPITSAAVHTTVGNIELLLKTI